MSKDKTPEELAIFDEALSSVNDTALFNNPNFRLAFEYVYKVEAFKLYLQRYKTYDKDKYTLGRVLSEVNRDCGYPFKKDNLTNIKTVRNSLVHDSSYVIDAVDNPLYVIAAMEQVDELHSLCRKRFVIIPDYTYPTMVDGLKLGATEKLTIKVKSELFTGKDNDEDNKDYK